MFREDVHGDGVAVQDRIRDAESAVVLDRDSGLRIFDLGPGDLNVGSLARRYPLVSGPVNGDLGNFGPAGHEIKTVVACPVDDDPGQPAFGMIKIHAIAATPAEFRIPDGDAAIDHMQGVVGQLIIREPGIFDDGISGVVKGHHSRVNGLASGRQRTVMEPGVPNLGSRRAVAQHITDYRRQLTSGRVEIE